MGRKLFWWLGFAMFLLLDIRHICEWRVCKKVYSVTVKRKLNHLLVDVSIGPGMLASISHSLVLVQCKCYLWKWSLSEQCSVK